MLSCNRHTESKIGSNGSSYLSRKNYKLSIREKIIFKRMITCPGFNGHTVFNQERIFERYVTKSHKAYVMYWRSHMDAYSKYVLRNKND